jgi:uncharacterized protein YkwD
MSQRDFSRRTACRVPAWMLSACVCLLLFSHGFSSVIPQNIPFVPNEEERTLFRKINEDRLRRDLPYLTLAYDASLLARYYSLLMANTGRVEHRDVHGRDTGARLALIGLRVARYGENLSRHRSVEEMHTSFMASGAHRDLILDHRYQEVAVGVFVDLDGAVYGTELFFTRIPYADEARAVQGLKKRFAELRRAQGLAPLLWNAALSDTLSLQASARSSEEARTEPLPVPAWLPGELSINLTFATATLEPKPSTEAALLDARFTHAGASVRFECGEDSTCLYRVDVVFYRGSGVRGR